MNKKQLIILFILLFILGGLVFLLSVDATSMNNKETVSNTNSTNSNVQQTNGNETNTETITQTTTPKESSGTPTVTPTKEQPTETVTPTAENSEESTSYDTSFVSGKLSQTVNGHDYKLDPTSNAVVDKSDGDKIVYTSSWPLVRFYAYYTTYMPYTYVYTIEKKADEANHYYFKRTNKNGTSATLWHFISSYVMEDFLIDPKTYDSHKVFYLLYSNGKVYMVQKIVNYSIEKSVKQTFANAGSIVEFVKLKDKDSVKLVIEGADSNETKMFDFSGDDTSFLFFPAKVNTSLCCIS